MLPLRMIRFYCLNWARQAILVPHYLYNVCKNFWLIAVFYAPTARKVDRPIQCMVKGILSYTILVEQLIIYNFPKFPRYTAFQSGVCKSRPH